MEKGRTYVLLSTTLMCFIFFTIGFYNRDIVHITFRGILTIINHMTLYQYIQQERNKIIVEQNKFIIEQNKFIIDIILHILNNK